MRVILPGGYPDNREFASEEVPKLVFQHYTDSQLGGKLVRKALKMDKRQQWRVLADTPERFEASVFLGKSSNQLILGRRRILVRAFEEEGRTLVELISTNKAWLVIAIGLLMCFVPGVFFAISKSMHDRFERKVMAKVGAEVKRRYPEAEVQD